MRIAVAGGSGTVGRYVLESAKDAGHDTVVLSRSSGVDLRSGEGLATVLAGVEVIIDTSNSDTTDGAMAQAFFVDVTRRLHAAGALARVQRLVTLSIVGIDDFPLGYYRAKLAQEAQALSGPLTANVVRATQFHEFAAQLLVRTKRGPLAVVPQMRLQPIAARTVGHELVHAALSPPIRPIVEIAGPRQESLVKMARYVVRQRGQRALVVALRVPGKAGRKMRSGALVATSDARLLGPTFDEWLATDDARLPLF